MSQKPRCVHCKRLFRPNPRLKEQRYCPQKACQRARKRLWQKHKMARCKGRLKIAAVGGAI